MSPIRIYRDSWHGGMQLRHPHAGAAAAASPASHEKAGSWLKALAWTGRHVRTGSSPIRPRKSR